MKNADACEALGAERGINYRTEDFVEIVKSSTEGKGADVILDMVGGDYVPREISCLADDGRLVFIALLGGGKANVSLGQILLRRLTLTGSTLRPRPVAVLAHMSPIYAVLAAPLVRPLRVPLLLWFTHWRSSRLLKLAERASTRVLTVDRRSFPFASAKVTPIGHGIDVAALPCVAPPPGPLRLLALGRTSPAKGLDTLVEAVRLLPDADVELELRGPVTDGRGAGVPLVARRADRAAGRAPRDRRRLRVGRSARQQHAQRGARQGGLRGSGVVPAGPRLEPRLRRARRGHRALAAVPAGRCDKRSRIASARWSTQGRKRARASAASCGRASSATTPSTAGPSACSRRHGA